MHLLSVYAVFCLLAIICAQLISSNVENNDDSTTIPDSVPILRAKRQFGPWGYGGPWGGPWGWRRPWFGRPWWARPWGPYYGPWGR